jgi:predicted phage replisome organizer
MSDNKKYYYLKLVDNFYERDEMIMLESMPDGYMYSNILLKLYLRSLKNEGKLMFNNRIPYNATMLANVTRFPVAVVEKAINIFKELGLIEILDNGAIYILDIQNFIGQSSTEADRKRAYRNRIEEEKKGLGQMSGQLLGHLSDKTPPEIDIEIELEKELELEIRDKRKEIDTEEKTSIYISSPENLKQFSKLYEQNIGLINGVSSEWIIEMSEMIDYKLFKRAIEIATDRNKCRLDYIKGIIKQWLDLNIKTYEQLKAYELQKKSQKGVKSDVRGRERTIETKSANGDPESEEARRRELLEQCRRLDED